MLIFFNYNFQFNVLFVYFTEKCTPSSSDQCYYPGNILKICSLVVPGSVLREQEKNWPCYECNRRFMSSEQLQQHLNMHDDKLNLIQRFEGFLRCS